MIDDTAQLDGFAALAAEYLDGRADEAGIAELRRRLHGEPACREIYVAVCLQSRLMRETLAERIASVDAGAGVEVEAEALVEPETAARRPAGRGWRIGFAAAMAAALLVGAAVAIAIVMNMAAGDPLNSPADRPAVAVMLDSDDAEWLSEPLAPGASVSARPVSLAGGSAEFELTSGVSLTVAGPAELTLDSGRRATLRRGLLIAAVPPGAEGFAVDVPGGGRVVDLGTRFAVLVDEAGRSFVYVLEGEVEYSGPTGSTAIAPIVATAGHGLAIEADGVAIAAAASSGVPESMRRPLRRFEVQAVRSWSPAASSSDAPRPAIGQIDRPFDGVDVSDGLTIEAAFRVLDASRWNDTTNWTLLRQEHSHRVLLALQASRFIGSNEGQARTAAAPGIGFGLFTGGYGELDVALDGEDGRPHFTELLDGRVHHVAAVYDAARSQKAIYLDGRLIGVEHLPAAAALRVPITRAGAHAPAPAAMIGGHGGVEMFAGSLLSVNVYDGPMPPRQIEQQAERWLRSAEGDANQAEPIPAIGSHENRDTQ